MSNTNIFMDLLEVETPIVLAPMAGVTNVEAVVAVCNAGGLGSLGAAGIKPNELRKVIREIKERTDKPFNVGLFAAHTEVFDEKLRPQGTFLNQLQDYHAEFNLGSVPETKGLFGPAEEQLDVCLSEQVKIVSFHFGVDKITVDKIHAAGAKVLCTATTVAEAINLEQAGVDVVVAQGSEAGGHRGTFIGDYKSALIGTMALVPQMVDAVSLPVIAAGGVMDERGLVACLALGAAAVQMGTAFLGCKEVSISDAWRDALHNANAEDVVVTHVMSGKPARGIRNRYIAELEQLEEPLLPYPAQYSISRKLRQVADAKPDFGAHWSGQGVGLFRDITVAELMDELTEKAAALTNHLAKS